jgi:hypothetical protein
MTQSEAFNANLAQFSDSHVVRGKLFFTLTTTTTPSLLINLYPNGPDFGQRIEALQNIYTRYRLKSLKVKYLQASLSGTIGSVAVGVQDDVLITGLAPTTTQGIAELRCSSTAFANQTVPSEFEWEPLDKKRWYYTQTTSAEPRTATYGSMFYSSSAPNGNLSVEIDYVFVFAGATNISSY